MSEAQRPSSKLVLLGRVIPSSPMARVWFIVLIGVLVAGGLTVTREVEHSRATHEQLTGLMH